MKEVFGAKPSKRHGNGSSLIFDKSKLERVGKAYDVSIEVKVTTNNNGEDGYDGEDIGLDKHLIEHGGNVDKAESTIDNCKNHDKFSNNNNKITLRDEDKSTGGAIDPPQPPHPTQMTAIHVTMKEQQPLLTISDVVDMSDRIYRLGSTDNWACKHCKLRGDTWFMKKHHCKGTTK
jgi:hypothetical protein